MTDTKRKLVRRKEKMLVFYKILGSIFLIGMSLLMLWAIYMIITLGFASDLWAGIATTTGFVVIFAIIGSIFYYDNLQKKIDRMK